jgi:hypothetical protein
LRCGESSAEQPIEVTLCFDRYRVAPRSHRIMVAYAGCEAHNHGSGPSAHLDELHPATSFTSPLEASMLGG